MIMMKLITAIMIMVIEIIKKERMIEAWLLEFAVRQTLRMLQIYP
jgi:hypothetical protein